MQFANMLPDSLLLHLLRQDSAGQFRERSDKVVIYHLDKKKHAVLHAAIGCKGAFLYENLTIGYYLAHSSAAVMKLLISFQLSDGKHQRMM